MTPGTLYWSHHGWGTPHRLQLSLVVDFSQRNCSQPSARSFNSGNGDGGRSSFDCHGAAYSCSVRAPSAAPPAARPSPLMKSRRVGAWFFGIWFSYPLSSHSPSSISPSLLYPSTAWRSLSRMRSLIPSKPAWKAESSRTLSKTPDLMISSQTAPCDHVNPLSSQSKVSSTWPTHA